MADPNNIVAEAKYRTAIAERGKFWVVDEDYLSTLGYPASGEGKYATLTYQVNPTPLTLSGDINLGQVEIKDGDSSTTVDVVALSGGNAMTTMIVDGEGNQITSFGSSTSEQSPSGVTANVTVVQAGAIAESTIPTPVADGDAVAQWFDTYGRQLLFGSNLSLNAQDVNLVNDSTLSRMGPIEETIASAVDGTTVDVSNYHNYTVHIIATNVTSGATVEIKSTFESDGTEAVTVATIPITVNGNHEIAISQQAYKYLLPSVPIYADGDYTFKIYAGN